MLSKFKFAILGFFLLLSVLCFCFDAYAQTEAEVFTAKNTVFAEAGGNAGRYAVNYGRIFHQKGMLKLSGSAGFSIWRHQIFSTYWLPVVPLEVSAFWGKSKHHLEIGSGITTYLETSPKTNPFTFEEEVVLSAVVPIRVGYRYQKPEGGFFFRVGYTPIFRLPRNSEGDINFQPVFAGLSLGMSF